MREFFLTLLNMSLVSCWLIIALLLLRPLLKKAPKTFVCALWGLVGLRLICPFSFESFLSLIPDSEPISKEIIMSQTNTAGTVVFDDYQTSGTVVSYTLAPPAGASLNPLQAISLVAAFIWAVGVAAMLIISLVSYLRLRKSVSASINTGGNVFINDDIASPFVLGLIKPRIYIPSSLTEYEKEYVIAHESAHIKRRDYLIKPLGYAILSLHWFNPLVWVAYILLCRDIESACDERVIKKMDDKGKKEYSEVLLRLSIPSGKVRACPVAFGEVGVKMRIKSVLNYKKPAFWIVTLAVVLAVVLSVGFLTNPVENNDTSHKTENTPTVSASVNDSEGEADLTKLEDCIFLAISENCRTENADTRFAATKYRELNTVSFNTSVTSYVWAYYGEYEKIDGKVELVAETFEPVKISLRKTDGVYEVIDYKAPEDKKNLTEIAEIFPSEYNDSVLYTPGYYDDYKAECLQLACEHFGSEHNGGEMYPVFNATVTEVYDKYIIVEPFKGEKVSRNTFERVSLSTKKLTSDSYIPEAGDAVRVRYADIINIDADPPKLDYVYTIEKLQLDFSQTSLPLVLYSGGGDGDYYFKEPDTDMIYIFTYEDVDIWHSGSYFSLNEENNSFQLMYMIPASEPLAKVSTYATGKYTLEEDRLVLESDDGLLTLCFEKSGDNYRFSRTLSDKLRGEVKDYPLEDGDLFQLRIHN